MERSNFNKVAEGIARGQVRTILKPEALSPDDQKILLEFQDVFFRYSFDPNSLNTNFNGGEQDIEASIQAKKLIELSLGTRIMYHLAETIHNNPERAEQLGLKPKSKAA